MCANYADAPMLGRVLGQRCTLECMLEMAMREGHTVAGEGKRWSVRMWGRVRTLHVCAAC